MTFCALQTICSCHEVSQLDVIRYFTLLSRLNFSIDTNFYPLGSCTMKYNPKLNDQIASLGGFANIHPLQDDESVQGALEVMFELQEWLGEVTGLPGVGLAPLAGAQGEYAGLLIARAVLEMRVAKPIATSHSFRTPHTAPTPLQRRWPV